MSEEIEASAPVDQPGRARRLPVMAAALGALGLYAGIAALLGQDASWDLRNYHYYNPHAFLNGRLFWDIQPAMRQTWFNPLIDVPYYLLAEALPPLGSTLALAAIQSVGLLLLFLLARRIVRAMLGTYRFELPLAATLAFAGAISPYNFTQIGATQGDNTTAILLLGALLCVVGTLQHPDRPPRNVPLLCAGFLAGLAVGLKLTNAPYALGLGAGLLLIPLPLRWKLRAVLLFGGSVAIGTLLTSGFWWWTIYSAFGNPLFPQYNHIFQSPYINPLPLSGNEKMVGLGVLGRLLHPYFYNRLVGETLSDWRFQDLRTPLLLVLFVLYAVSVPLRRARSASGAPRRPELDYLIAALFVAYASWLIVFGVPRYLMLLDMLMPLVGFVLLARLVPDRSALALATGALLISLLITFRPVANPRVGWAQDLLAVSLPSDMDFRNALVIMAGDQPSSYVIPSFPSTTRFVRTAGNLYFDTGRRSLEQRHANQMGALIRRALAEHTGPFYVLFPEDQRAAALEDLAFFGFDLAADREASIARPTNRTPFIIAGVRRRS